jgi:hypothetical protein
VRQDLDLLKQHQDFDVLVDGAKTPQPDRLSGATHQEEDERDSQPAETVADASMLVNRSIDFVKPHTARQAGLNPEEDRELRPLRLPTWSDKLVAEVVRLLLEANYEPQFSDRSDGFRPGRGGV